MNKRIAMKWVDTLRSDLYEQATGTLQDHHGAYCCLGVLCKIAESEGIKLETYGSVDAPVGTINGGNLGAQKKVRQWSGMKSNDGVIDIHDNHVTLALLNDSYITNDGINLKLTFDEIADIIQVLYKEL